MTSIQKKKKTKGTPSLKSAKKLEAKRRKKVAAAKKRRSSK